MIVLFFVILPALISFATSLIVCEVEIDRENTNEKNFNGYGLNSRAKGARYERELASAFRAEGYNDARRGQQYCGANGDADVVGLPGIHVEAKHVERLQLYNAMAQARPFEF